MSDINKVELRGRLTRPPELRYTPSGIEVASFSIATGYRPKEGDQKTEYHNCVAWREEALTIAEKQKGDELHFTGRLQTRSWEDKNSTPLPNGKMRKLYKTEIVVWKLLDEPDDYPRTAADEERQARKPQATNVRTVEAEDETPEDQTPPRSEAEAPLSDDIPF